MFLAVPSWISHNWWSGSSYQYIHEAPNVGLEDMDSPLMRGQQFGIRNFISTMGSSGVHVCFQGCNIYICLHYISYMFV